MYLESNCRLVPLQRWGVGAGSRVTAPHACCCGLRMPGRIEALGASQSGLDGSNEGDRTQVEVWAPQCSRNDLQRYLECIGPELGTGKEHTILA